MLRFGSARAKLKSERASEFVVRKECQQKREILSHRLNIHTQRQAQPYTVYSERQRMKSKQRQRLVGKQK